MPRIFTVNDAQNAKFDENDPAYIESKKISDLDLSAKFKIDLEKTNALLCSDRISKQLIEIVFNRTGENSLDSMGWKKFLLYCMVGILAPSICLCSLTLIPTVDLMRYPEYYYLQLFVAIPLALLLSAGTIVNCSAWMNIKIINNWKNHAICSLLSIVALGIVWSLGTLLWTRLGYYPPVPFSGLIAGYGILICNYVTIWFLFKKEWRKITEFRKRLKYFILALALSQVLTVQYNIIAKFLLEYKDNYQWVIALTLPFSIEFNSWVVTKLATKASGGDIRTVEVNASHFMATRHALFLTYTLGSIATDTTSNIIMATDFLLYLSLAIRLIRLKKKDPYNAEKQIDLLQGLALSQMIEFVVPLVYVLVFCSAYFGPNAHLIGNVKNSYFQYNKVENVVESIKSIGIFLLVDIFSLISNTVILRTFANISLYKALCVYLKEYGVIFTINLTLIFYTVSIYIIHIPIIHLLNHLIKQYRNNEFFYIFSILL